jgi:hypothetical protein
MFAKNLTNRTLPEAKPTYPNAFDLIAGLPPEVNPVMGSLLLWIWRHTNSVESHENYGKAWKSQSNLAQEMHVSDKTVQRAFDDAEARGFISREHLFKKNGKVIVSTAPYRKATSKGMGEFLYSRCWINWSFIRELQLNGMVKESTPNQTGVVRESTPNQIGVVRESRPVVTESTKGLIEGFALAVFPSNCPSVEPTGGDSERHVVVVGDAPSQSPAAGKDDFPLYPPAAGLDVLTQSPSDGSPTPSVPLPGDTAQMPPGLGKSKAPQETRSEKIIDDARKRQVERTAPDAEVYREVKAVFDRLRQEYKARQNFEPRFFHDPNDPRAAGLVFEERGVGENKRKWVENPAYAAMPLGKDFENDLQATKDHRHDAAEMYRVLGRDVTLAKWEDWLVNADHDVPQRVEYEEGKFATDTVERSWLLHDFVLACGVSTAKATG